jgi:hypothetical protein
MGADGPRIWRVRSSLKSAEQRDLDPLPSSDLMKLGLLAVLAGGLMAVTADLAKLLDKAYEDKTLAELVDAPV